MKVVLANTAGFCAGVKNAMKIAVDAARRSGGLRSFGPLIHNEQAVKLLHLRGVAVSSEPARPGESILIRAHGVDPAARREWEGLGCRLIDATCVHVARNQRLAAAAAAAGKRVLVAGDAGHAEVQAVLGAAGADALVVSASGDVDVVPADKAVFLLAQTTFESDHFQRIAARVAERFPDAEIRNTVCLATERRQREAKRLASLVDAVVVVGGRHSANTQRLAEVAREAGKPAVLVETAGELDPADFAGMKTVGVTAGASTPGWITQAVVDELRGMGPVSWTGRLERALGALLEARVLTALSAAGLAISAQFLVGAPFQPGLAVAAGLYVFFAHIVNRRVPDDRELRKFTGVDPFYTRHRVTLLVLAWSAAAAAVVLAWQGGVQALFFLAVLAALGHSRLVVERIPPLRRWRGVPGVRIALTALGWALVAAGPAAKAAGRPLAGPAVVLFVFFACFAKTLFRDQCDLESDHLMGLETLAVALGSRRAARLAAWTMRLCGAIPLALLAVTAWRGAASPAWAAFCVFLSVLYVAASRLIDADGKPAVADPTRFQALLEAPGCAAGAAALLLGAVI